MKDYQEALDTLECNAIQWASNHKYNEKHNFYIDSEMCDEMLNHSKLLQQLIDEKVEQESRKDKLIVGSEWECICKTYGKVKIIDIHPLSKTVTFRNMLFSQTEKIDDFILCFKPLKEGDKDDR